MGSRSRSLVALVVALSLALAACSSPQRPTFSGRPYLELASWAKENGVSPTLAEDCSIDLSIDAFDDEALAEYSTWIPPANLTDDVLASLTLTNLEWPNGREVHYCGRLEVQQMPAPAQGSPGLQAAVDFCSDIQPVVYRTGTTQFAGQLEEAVGSNNTVRQLASMDPRYVSLERYHFYAFNLFDYVQGLEGFLEQKPVFSGGSSINVDVDSMSVNSVLGMLESGNDLYNRLSNAARLLDGASVEAQRICDVVDDVTQSDDANSNDSVEEDSATLPCADGGVCVVGDVGPGDGIVFYVADERQDWGQYLEVATDGWSGDRRDPGGWWCGKDNRKTRKKVEGLQTRSEIGSGAENTQRIIQACGENNAAGKAASSVAGGWTDWFLPSRDELEVLIQNRGRIDISLNPYDGTKYYSSSNSAKDVWAWNRETRRVEKTSMFYDPGESVRPIRAF